jgi:hypothetical protein
MGSSDSDWTPRFRLSDGRTDVNALHLYEVRGKWEHPSPTACQCGAQFRAGTVTIGWQACLAIPGRTGHLTYRCESCAKVIPVPDETEACDHRPFDGR